MVKSSRSLTKADSPLSSTVSQKVEPVIGITDVRKVENNDENVKIEHSTNDTKTFSSAGSSQPKQSPVKRAKTNKRRKQTYCLCEGEDDGTPMIRCEGPCKRWYHFRCVSLSEEEAEEIAFYICPNCHKKTGLFTVMEWEGPDAMETVASDAPWPGEAEMRFESNEATVMPQDIFRKEEELTSSDQTDESEDDYIADSSKRKSKEKRTRRVSVSSESTEAEEGFPKSSARRRATRGAKADISVSVAKRKVSNTKTPPPKRLKLTEGGTSTQDDPVRKYCLGKLKDVIQAIFLEFTTAETQITDEGTELDGASSNLKNEVMEDYKQIVIDKAAAYVSNLEDNLFEKYSEPDKSGKASAGGKYKEHFRMLTFNLGKSDRVPLRKGIATGRIPASQLSVMSSTDLASEHLKQEMELAEKEALEHSILQKITAPRAKITHKGLESIEDENGGVQITERQKEESEQRMERERLARLRSMSINRDQASPVLPESPTTSNAAWGQMVVSPITPVAHGLESSALSSQTTVGVARRAFSPSSEIMAPPDTALALTDLINIDDEPPQNADSPVQPTLQSGVPNETIAPSGPSPFALSNLNSPKQDLPPERTLSLEQHATGVDLTVADTVENVPMSEDATDDAVDMEVERGESEDPDFDMFLEPDKNENSLEASKSTEPLDFNTLPRLWSGAIVMPLESLVPLAPSVVASQVGGRILDSDPQLWKQLFPTAEVRIDGRVPVDKSSQYLLTNRLNSSKELIAVYFASQPSSDPSSYNELIDYLTARGRHALVFPWGTHPSPNAPGRELYIVPLLRDHPIPEFIEMLDNLQLPSKRDTNLLLGVFVLNKGKLVPPPAASISLPKADTSANSVPLSTANITLPPNINPSSLAAEVASLTPDQIALMLRHLGQSIPPAQTTTPLSAPVQIVPSLYSVSAPTASFSPLQRIPLQKPPNSPDSGRPYMSNNHNDSYGRNEYERNGRSPYDREDRGRGHHRGRGRSSRGRDHDRLRFRNTESLSRISDSGWSGRGRGIVSRSPPKG